MNKILSIMTFVAMSIMPVSAQTVLSLDSCRAMALRNNKQLNATRMKQEVAENARKAARTNYLPKVDILGGYEYFSKEVSLLNDRQKTMFSTAGSTALGAIGQGAGEKLKGLVENRVITLETAQQISGLLQQFGAPIAQGVDKIGQDIVDAFKTDTHNVFAGTVMVRQPLYMGGAIIAANKMADISEDMAKNEYEGKVQSTLYQIDETYWLVVSLKQKKALAESFRDVVQKLDDDVHKMIDEGLLTRADGLKVDVKVNEADMAVTMVEDGLSLSKMLLCQLIGLPVDTDIVLADENKETLTIGADTESLEGMKADGNRSELRMLQNAVDLTKQGTNLVRAAYLPHVALTGGYVISNPNVLNGFQKKFSGMWNVGVTVQIPVWNWLEGAYKVRAGKATTNIAMMELSDASEKINLQVEQSRFKVKEANKKLAMATKNLANAEENLRCANVGFREGVMQTTEVMSAQAAWEKAKSMKIDAEIDVMMSEVNLKKALGILR